MRSRQYIIVSTVIIMTFGVTKLYSQYVEGSQSGYNRINSVIPSGNMYITGNVTGGASFQGSVPYSSGYEFQGSSGINTLSNFRRDSSSLSSAYSNSYSVRGYVDRSRGVSGSVGGRVANTSRYFSQGSSVNPYSTSQIGHTYSGRPASKSVYGNSQYLSSGNIPVAIPGRSSLLWSARMNSMQQDQDPIRSQSAILGDYQKPSGVKVDLADNKESDDVMQEYLELFEAIRKDAELDASRLEEAVVEDSTEESIDGIVDIADTQRGKSSDRIEPGKMELAHSGIVSGDSKKLDLAKLIAARVACHKKRAQDYYLQGKYYKASGECATAIAYNPSDMQVNILFAESLLASGEYYHAANVIIKAFSYVNQSMEFAGGRKGDILFSGYPAEIDKLINRTGSWEFGFLKSFVFYSLGDIDKAKVAIDQVPNDYRKSLPVKSLSELIDLAHQK